ncbi:hypothetical protein [Pseudooceanicola sp. HF7]|nr:hypothetical protein [Pseudooceanicola sp. HF7]
MIALAAILPSAVGIFLPDGQGLDNRKRAPFWDAFFFIFCLKTDS